MTTITDWLNSLTATEAAAVYSLMCRTAGLLDPVRQVEGAPPTNLNCLLANTPRSGNWYLRWVECEMIGLTLPPTGHPRWQPRVVKDGVTPASATSVGRKVKRRVEESSWESLKSIARANNSGGQVKIPCHHLAFRAAWPDVSIPANMGRGASISHLCDTSGCVRGEHLELTVNHVDNLERQRCSGVTLIVAADLIVHELPCSHSRGNNPAELIATSCRKLRVIWLPDASVQGLLDTYRQILDTLLGLTPNPSQT
jgi:hypothetical protein